MIPSLEVEAGEKTVTRELSAGRIFAGMAMICYCLR